MTRAALKRAFPVLVSVGVLLFLFGIPILLVMGMVGLGTAMAAG
mgnify:CR=1 FL=1